MSQIARFLRTLLQYKGAVLVAGMAVLVVLILLREILKMPIFAELDQNQTAGVLTLIVRSAFWIALAAVVIAGLTFILPARLFLPVPTMQYAVAVARMIDPLEQDMLAQLRDGFEPHTSFPYYSRESDHPSFWPPRRFKDMSELADRRAAYFEQPQVIAAWASVQNDSKIKALGAGDKQFARLQETIMNARQLFNRTLHGDADALARLVGPKIARPFLELEAIRAAHREGFPNRIAIVRIRNSTSRTVRDVTLDYEVAGSVYDWKLRTDNEAESPDFQPFEHRIVIDRLLPDQTYDLTIWYRYQSAFDRVFADEINFIHELTQGFTLSNIAIASGRAMYNATLVKDLKAYDRLYLGNGRPSDNPAKELQALFKKHDAGSKDMMEAYAAQHLEKCDLSFEELAELPIAESQIENIWVQFSSPAGQHYCAVHVFEHPQGPYVLLTSKSKDRDDFVLVRDALAETLDGTAEEKISDRGDDICCTIGRESGFDRPRIAAAFAQLLEKGYRNANIQVIHYAAGASS